MKITVLSRLTPFHGIGGMQQIAWDLAVEMQRRGADVRMLTTACDDPAMTQQDLPVEVVEGSIPKRFNEAWWRETAAVADQVYPGEDAVLSVGIAGASCVPLLDGVQSIFQCHGTWRDELHNRRGARLRAADPPFIRRELTMIRHASATVAVGPRVASTLAKIPYRFAKGRIHTIPNGIDERVFHPGPSGMRAKLGIADDSPLVLTATRFTKDKGVARSLEAVALAREAIPGLRHVVLGRGPEEGALKDLVRKMGLEETVIWPGVLDRADVPALYRAADAFLFTPFRREGHPLNVLEALASGLPIATSTRVLDSTLPLEHFHAAPYRDASGLAEALRRALETGGAMDSLLPSALTLESCVQAYVNLLEA